jgi:hypothetical protein
MDIGILRTLILVASIIWIPIMGIFTLFAFFIALVLPFKGSFRKKLSNSMLCTGILFIPSEIIIIKYFYANEQTGPPFWFNTAFALLGFFVFFVISIILRKKSEN